MKVTIRRNKWCRGVTRDDDDNRVFSALLTYSGHRCCLGFLGQACGLTDNEMQWRPVPSDTESDAVFPLPLFQSSGQKALLAYDNPRESRLADLPWEQVFTQFNDDERIDEPTREEWIAAGFRLVLGVDVEFIDGEEPGS